MYCGDILDAIPIVGHIKGIVHLISGDVEAGERSMYVAGRSTVAISGAVTALGGPAGMAAALSAASVVTNCLSFLTEKPSRITSDDTYTTNSSKAITLPKDKDIVIENHGTIIVEGERRPEHRYSRVRRSSHKIYARNSGSSENSKSPNSINTSSSKGQPFDTYQQSNNSNASTSSGDDAPAGQGSNTDLNNQTERYEKSTESSLRTFSKEFMTLRKISINGEKIFEYINYYSNTELRHFITNINNNYKHFDFAKIVKITSALLSDVEQDLLTSHDFVNVAKFVLAYLCQKLTEYNECFRDSTKTFNTRRAELAEIITPEDELSFSHIKKIFRNLLDEIGELSTTIDPQFVNATAAVYHYFKHKFIESQNILFAPAGYFDLVRQGLERLRTFPQFGRLIEARKRKIVYQRYYGAIGRRLNIVIKEHRIGRYRLRGRLREGFYYRHLFSWYFEDDIHEDDEDGDEWINDEKLPRK